MLWHVFESSLSKKIFIFTAQRIYFLSLHISSPWCKVTNKNFLHSSLKRKSTICLFILNISPSFEALVCANHSTNYIIKSCLKLLVMALIHIFYPQLNSWYRVLQIGLFGGRQTGPRYRSIRYDILSKMQVSSFISLTLCQP